MVLIAGSANLDFVVRAPHIPTPGETVLGYGFATFPGGKGANQAVACARAGGVTTAMLLALGSDAYAQPLLDSLTQAGVQLHTLRVAEQATGTAFICVDDGGENAITVAPGANLALLPQHLPSLQGVTHLLMQLEIPLPSVLAYARAARAQGVQVVLNAAPARALPAELLALLDVLIVNQGELATILAALPAPATAPLPATDTATLAPAAALPTPAAAQPSPASSAHAALCQQLAQLPVPCVVVTLGGAGSLARQGGQFISQPTYPVQVVDSTGAGDTFCGVLVAAQSQGAGLASALRSASAAAALACTQLGAQSSIPSHSAVQALLQQNAAP